MSNLRFVKQEKSTSAVSTMKIEDCFSADYDIYKVSIFDTQYGPSNTDVAGLRVRFINSSGSTIVTLYEAMNMNMKADAGKDEDKFQDGAYFYSPISIGNYENAGGIMYIYTPFSSSCYTIMTGEGAGGYDVSSNRARSSKCAGFCKHLSSVTGIELYPGNASNTFQATVTVHGLRVDS